MRGLQRQVRDAMLALPLVDEHPSQWAPRQAFWVDGRQFAEFVATGAIQLRLTRKGIAAQRARLRSDERVELGRGDWITVRFRRVPDVAFVAELASIAADANRRAPGEPPRRMPHEAELSRRRRQHRATTEDLG